MALLQISEPGQTDAPHQHNLAAGIDLGTTNSLVASVRSAIAETLPDQEGHHLLHCVLHQKQRTPRRPCRKTVCEYGSPEYHRFR